jgi:hypothetical protein
VALAAGALNVHRQDAQRGDAAPLAFGGMGKQSIRFPPRCRCARVGWWWPWSRIKQASIHPPTTLACICASLLPPLELSRPLAPGGAPSAGCTMMRSHFTCASIWQ